MAATYFDLSTESGRNRFKFRVNKVFQQRKYVRLETLSPQRTVSQNSYLHLCLQLLASETGETLQYVKEQYYKRLVNPDLFLITKYDEYAGNVVLKVRSSADLSKEQMATSIDRLKIWCSKELGVVLPDAEDKEAQAEALEEIEKAKNYI